MKKHLDQYYNELNQILHEIEDLKYTKSKKDQLQVLSAIARALGEMGHFMEQLIDCDGNLE